MPLPSLVAPERVGSIPLASSQDEARSTGRRRVGTQDGRSSVKHSKCLAESSLFVSLLFVASTQVAHAYVDPGTGSYVIQILIAALAGAAFAVKIYWGRIKGIFSRSSSDGQDTESDEQ